MSSIKTSSQPILITGATGFVGSYVIHELLKQGIEPGRIIGVGLSGETTSGQLKSLSLDLTDKAQTVDLLETIMPCVVIHLAGIADTGQATKNQNDAWRINFEATRTLAETLFARTPEARFIFAGSAESYGKSFNSCGLPLLESAALNPLNVYGATKGAADLMLGQMQRQGLDVVRFRAFNHSGPGQRDQFVLPAFASQISKMERGEVSPILNVGNLETVRDFLDVRDVASAYALAALAEKSAFPTSALNVCSGVGRTIQSIVDTLLALSSIDISVSVDPKRRRPSEVPIAIGDNSLLRDCLGWKPVHEFNETISAVLDTFRGDLP